MHSKYIHIWMIMSKAIFDIRSTIWWWIGEIHTWPSASFEWLFGDDFNHFKSKWFHDCFEMNRLRTFPNYWWIERMRNLWNKLWWNKNQMMQFRNWMLLGQFKKRKQLQMLFPLSLFVVMMVYHIWRRCFSIWIKKQLNDRTSVCN